MYLVEIETSGNQNFIFATNKLRENVGASELTYRVGTEWVLNAISENGGPKLWDNDPRMLRKNLLDPEKNPSITKADANIEVVLATSGKVLFLAKEKDQAEEIIADTTEMALTNAPGIDVCGAVSAYFEWTEISLHELLIGTQARLEEIHSRLPGPAMRFPRLPVVDECATSGLPAYRWDLRMPDTDSAARSLMSVRKLDAALNAAARIKRLFTQGPDPLDFERNISQLEERTDWIAIVHCDGNGLGQIFLKFAEYAECSAASKNVEYVDKLRRFSIALDICTERAFSSALLNLPRRDVDGKLIYPLVPIVLGGDDMTVICDGRTALKFAHDFLCAFEAETSKTGEDYLGGIIPEIARRAADLNIGRLSACAGVAVVKPHFPFSSAYRLAEELIQSAKSVKKLVSRDGKSIPCSAIDFHVLYDSVGSGLDDVRARLEVDRGNTRLYGRPLVVTTSVDLDGAGDPFWLQSHLWTKFEVRVKALQSEVDGRPALPSGQMHFLREGLFLGVEAAESRYALIRPRYLESGIERLEGEPGKLFWVDENRNGRSIGATGLLDALDAVAFLDMND